jgi:hypothetical protein
VHTSKSVSLSTDLWLRGDCGVDFSFFQKTWPCADGDSSFLKTACSVSQFPSIIRFKSSFRRIFSLPSTHPAEKIEVSKRICFKIAIFEEVRVKLLIRRYETMMMLKYPAEGNLLPDQEYPAFGVLHGCGTVTGIINRAV